MICVSLFRVMNSQYDTFFSSCIVRSVDSLDAGIYAEIRTRIPDTISWDYNFEPAGSTPITFTVKVLLPCPSDTVALKIYLELQLLAAMASCSSVLKLQQATY